MGFNENTWNISDGFTFYAVLYCTKINNWNKFEMYIFQKFVSQQDCISIHKSKLILNLSSRIFIIIPLTLYSDTIICSTITKLQCRKLHFIWFSTRHVLLSLKVGISVIINSWNSNYRVSVLISIISLSIHTVWNQLIVISLVMVNVCNLI